jgi:hypothetical protein
MLRNEMIRRVWLLGLVILLAGCSLPGVDQQPTSIATEGAATTAPVAATQVSRTATPAFVLSPTWTPTIVTITPQTVEAGDSSTVLEGETTVTSINLRSGPSTIHDVVGTYNIGTVVTVLAQTPDHIWYYVQPRDNQFGWMYAEYLKLYSEDESIPETVPTQTTLFKGKVVNASDQSGVSKVNLAIVQGTGDQILRAEAFTTETGEFEAYLPKTISGAWRVLVVGVDCKSNIMDNACIYTGSFAPDLGFSFTLPDIPDLTFTYTP